MRCLVSALGIPVGHSVVGTVAAMAGHKDYPNLLKAAEIVTRSREDVTFCALGDGPDRESILRQAQRLDLGDRFVFAGFRKDPRPFLALFDVFVLASKREGLGTAVIEAQAAGLPVVVCRTGGLPEIVQHGRNGLLVPPRDPGALARAVLSLVDDTELRRRLADTARQDAGRFSIAATVEQYVRLYETIWSARGEGT